MIPLKIGQIQLAIKDKNVLLGIPQTNNQKDFKNSLHELLKWLKILKIEKLIFQAGKDLILPDWFKDECRKLGISVEIHGMISDEFTVLERIKKSFQEVVVTFPERIIITSAETGELSKKVGEKFDKLPNWIRKILTEALEGKEESKITLVVCLKSYCP